MIEYRNRYLREMKTIKSYLAGFKEASSMKSKVSPENSKIGGINR